MPQLPQPDKARSNWWYYRTVFGIVLLSLVISFWRIYRHQAQLNREVESSIQELRQEKLLCDKESSALIHKIVARMEMGVPFYPAIITQLSDSDLNEKAIPLILANLKDGRNAVVDHALSDLEALLSEDKNGDRWNSDLETALLPMLENGTHDRELVKLLMLVGTDQEEIRRRLLQKADYDDINTVLQVGWVMRLSVSDLDPLPLYIDYLRQRDLEALKIVRQIEMDDIGMGESMRDRFFPALQREMLEAKTPEEQARIQVWIDYVKDPSTLPERFQTSPWFMQGPF